MESLCKEELLEIHRDRIQLIDEEVSELLKQRMDTSIAIGKIKKENNIAVCDPCQEVKVLERVTKLAKTNGLDSEFVVKLYRLIMEESKRLQ